MNATTVSWQVRRHPGRARRLVTGVGALVVVIALGVPLAACSATADGSASPPNGASSRSGAGTAGPLAFARCMRTHGVHDFPDPNSNGSFDLSGEGALSPTNPTYRSAAQACRSLGSAGKGAAPSPTPQQIAATVQFAQCMRTHGVPTYPDPNSNGIIPGIRHFGIDPSSPAFQSATAACQHYMQGVPGWSS